MNTTSSLLTFIRVFVAALFLRDPSKEFNAHIDAPAEEKVLQTQGETEAAPYHDKEALHHAHLETVDQ
jgi:hypothetical protein